MSKPTFYMPYDDQGVGRMFTDWGWEKAASLPVADLVVFTGGEDVTPFLYGEPRHPATYSNMRRDMNEVRIFKLLASDKPKVGICRGGQFLNVMCGGRLWQDVDNHATGFMHMMREVSGAKRTLQVTSTHHQMMIPKGNYELLGVASESTEKANGSRTVKFTPDLDGSKHTDAWLDVEVVYYPEHNALCYQPHPEYSYVKGNDENESFFMEMLHKHVLPDDVKKLLDKEKK